MLRSNGILAAATLAAVASAHAGIVVSTFDTDADGWKVADAMNLPNQSMIGSALYESSLGNPTGFIAVPEPFFIPGDIAFVAPSKFLGNKSAALGGVLQFDRKIWSPGLDYSATQVDYAVDVVISGNGVTLGYNLPVITHTIWKTYTLPLDVGMGWFNVADNLPATHAQLLAVLSNLDDLRLRANLDNKYLNAGVDNVMLIPTPASIALLGIAGLTAFRRRR
ncbi:MAG: hypothetical protein KIS87_14455 [Phycisphaeraceae bacterium]|nr:hypothetical protein [Phycisphaeraceae bacterium]